MDDALGSPPPQREDELDEIPTLADLLKEQARLRRVIDPDELFTNHTCKEYLERLSNLSLDALHSEPALIREEADFVAGELTSLCFREYRTFIMVHRCSSEVQTAFSSFTSSLDSLLDAVPVLEAQCQTFAASTKATQQNRSKAALVLEHHDRLQDLLEVPQLLETCIRSGYYHEALELGAHARQMEEKYGNVAIVKDVGREVEKGLMGMLVQLLALLREMYKLPALVKAVGFLRRMDVLSEEELRVAFLTGREHNYRTQLVEIEREKGDPFRYVRRYIDVFREHVYDIIAQFTTIFIDNPSISSASSPTVTPPPILNTFAQQSISALLTLLRSQVPLIEDASSLSSLLTQLNYCASSFSRVGLDFRFLVSEPFEQAVLAANLKSLKEGESTLESSLREALRTGKPPPSWLVSTDSRSTVLELDLSPSSSFPIHLQPTSPQTPPTFLAHFPPLAQLCNSHTVALNSLRLFAPLTTFPQLVHQLVKSLLRSATFILSYAQTSASEFQTAAGSTPSSAGCGGGGGAGTGVGGRPGHRRNPSVSAGPSIQEQTDSKLVLRAFGRTFVDGLVPFLLRGLVEGVFDSEMGDVGSSLERLGVELDKGSVGELRKWVEKMERGLRPETEEDSTTTSSSTSLLPPPPTTTGKKNPAASPLMEEPDEIDFRDTQEGAEEEGADLDGQIAALEGSSNGVANGGEGADTSADAQPKEDGTGSSPTPVPS